MAPGAVGPELVGSETHRAEEEPLLQETARGDDDPARVPGGEHAKGEHRREQKRPGGEPPHVDLPSQGTATHEPPGEDEQAVVDPIRREEEARQSKETRLPKKLGGPRARGRPQEPDVAEDPVPLPLAEKRAADGFPTGAVDWQALDEARDVVFLGHGEGLGDPSGRDLPHVAPLGENAEAAPARSHDEEVAVLRELQDAGSGSSKKDRELGHPDLETDRLHAEGPSRRVQPGGHVRTLGGGRGRLAARLHPRAAREGAHCLAQTGPRPAQAREHPLSISPLRSPNGASSRPPKAP